MNAADLSIASMLRLIAGLLIWSSAFVTLYATLSLGCQQLQPEPQQGLLNPVTAMLVGLSLIHGLALFVLIGCWLKRPAKAAPAESEASRRFRHRVEGLVLLFSLGGLIWLSIPILMVAPCAG